MILALILIIHWNLFNILDLISLACSNEEKIDVKTKDLRMECTQQEIPHDHHSIILTNSSLINLGENIFYYGKNLNIIKENKHLRILIDGLGPTEI